MAIRSTNRVGGRPTCDVINSPVKGATAIDQGNMVCLDASGRAVQAADATLNLKPVGRAKTSVNNTGADGALRIDSEPGNYVLENSTAGDAITEADVLNDCYLAGPAKVAKTSASNTRSVAGKILGLESGGVIVAIGPR